MRSQLSAPIVLRRNAFALHRITGMAGSDSMPHGRLSPRPIERRAHLVAWRWHRVYLPPNLTGAVNRRAESVVVVAALLVALFLFPETAQASTEDWTKNRTFDGSPPANWRREHYKWSTDGSCVGPLDEAWFWGNGYGGAHGGYRGENNNCFGVITFKQGNTWDTGWNPSDPSDLPPLTTYGKTIDLHATFKRVNDGDYNPWHNGRIMYAVNIWFRSPELGKPLVMDLIFDVGPWDCWASFEDRAAYHYQFHVPRKSNAGCNGWGHNLQRGRWYDFHVDLDWHIKNALCNLNGYGFNLCHAEDTLQAEQAEMLLELQEAWGEFEIDNFAVSVFNPQ